MSEVVSINRGKFLGSYCDARDERAPQIYFAAGVLLSFGLSQIIFGVYGGAVVVAAYAGSASIGVAWGLVNYFRKPYRLPSIVGGTVAAQSPPAEAEALEDAA